MIERAYSLLTIRSADANARTIEGVASTPAPDRYNDIIEPEGAQFEVPMPLLWQHQHDSPVGTVEFARATPEGIPFRASIADVKDAGKLKDRLDEAWQSIQAGLIRAVSIGFRPLEYSYMDNGGIRFKSWEWLELSLVTIPANTEAVFNVVRSIDKTVLAASGEKKRGHVVRLDAPIARAGANPFVIETIYRTAQNETENQ